MKDHLVTFVDHDDVVNNLYYFDTMSLIKKYKADILISNRFLWYENNTYVDNAIKDEEAYTLYIILGEGKGSNWWGTIYPEFLGISSEEEIKYKSFFYELFTKGEIK